MFSGLVLFICVNVRWVCLVKNGIVLILFSVFVFVLFSIVVVFDGSVGLYLMWFVLVFILINGLS